MDTNIKVIAKNICDILLIEYEPIEKIIDEKLSTDNSIINNKELLNKIELLLKSDNDIKKFEQKIKNPEVLQNFENLKKTIGKLQVMTLIKQLEKSKNCDDILHSLFVVLNNKIKNVTTFVKVSSDQKGGSINFYKKYLKYKNKVKKINHLLNLFANNNNINK